MIIFALVWTDDVLFAYSQAAKALYERFLKEVYGKRWNFKRKGPVSKYVGLSVQRNLTSGKTWLSMPEYITGVFHRFVPKGHINRTLPVKNKESLKAVTVAANDTERKAMATRPYLAAPRAVGVLVKYCR